MNVLNIIYSVSLGDDSTPEWNKIRMCTPASGTCLHPRPARTKLLVIERGRFNGKPATKVLLCPITGRRHQVLLFNFELKNKLGSC